MVCNFLKFVARPYFFSSFVSESSKADVVQTLRMNFFSGSLKKVSRKGKDLKQLQLPGEKPFSVEGLK